VEPAYHAPKRIVRTRVVLTSGAMLFLAVQAGIGAPPSEFVPQDSVWRSLDPLMWPALFAGVVLAFIALVASALPPVPIKVATTFCFLASLSTAAGVISAAGISDHHALGFYAVMLGLVGLPGVLAARLFIARGRTD